MRWLVALALSGCFNKPEFAPHDAAHDDGIQGCTPSKPSAPGLAVDTAPAGALATMTNGTQIGFGSVLNRYPMPDRLIVAGQNLVGPVEGCAYEDRVGVAVYPIFSIAAQSPIGMLHSLAEVVVGPAFTLVQTFWTYPLPGCTSGANNATGNTTWSIFPDGKVVRNDTVVPAQSGNLMTAGCRCSGAVSEMAFAITSYTSLSTMAVDAITYAGQAEQTTLPAGDVAQRGACAHATSGGKLALWWDRIDVAEPATPPTRIRVNPVGHNIAAFVYDMVATQQMMTSIAANASYGVRTHMQLSNGAETCVDLLSTLESFVTIQPIQINGTQVPYSSVGVFEDAREFSEPVTVAGALPDGFTIHLRFPGFTAVATNRAADRVIWQRQSDGSFFLFFKDGLGGAPITVTPECAS